MNWFEIQGCHFNLDQVVSFEWKDGFLRIDTTMMMGNHYSFNDPDCYMYQKLCDACCMNIADNAKEFLKHAHTKTKELCDSCVDSSEKCAICGRKCIVCQMESQDGACKCASIEENSYCPYYRREKEILLDAPKGALSTELPETEKEETVQGKEYDDAFFINSENGSVTWMYYNPDSVAGGQYVTNMISFEDILDAAQGCTSTDDFFDYLGSIASQTLADIGTEWFGEAEREFRRTPDLTDLTADTMKALIEIAKKNRG